MGMLVDGTWTEDDQNLINKGAFERKESIFRDFVTRDGATGFKAEKDRYHLYVAHG